MRAIDSPYGLTHPRWLDLEAAPADAWWEMSAEILLEQRRAKRRRKQAIRARIRSDQDTPRWLWRARCQAPSPWGHWIISR